MKNKNKKLGYYVSIFPQISHTFISREIGALKKYGLDILVFSLRKPKEGMFSQEDRRYLSTTIYLLPLKFFPFLLSCLYYLFKAPYKFVKLFIYVLTRRETKLKDRGRSAFHFFEAIYLARMLEREGVTHLHVHFAAGPATSAMIISKLINISFSFTAHGTATLLEGTLLKEKIEQAKFIIAVSNYNKRYLAKIAPKCSGKIHVVYCGIDPNQFLPSTRKKDTFVILSIGRLVWMKGHAILIYACEILKQRGFEFNCLIVGDGPDRQKLEDLIVSCKLTDCIQLCGAILQENIQEFYDSAGLFVLPSFSEGLPVVLMEAMSKEIPVVATNITGIPEIVIDGVNGVLVPPKNSLLLADSLISMIQNESLRKKMGKEGRNIVSDKFCIYTNSNKLKSIFEKQLS